MKEEENENDREIKDLAGPGGSDLIEKTEERKLRHSHADENIIVNEKIDNPYTSGDQKAYKVLKYISNCEEHNQISYVIPLVKSIPKFILYIFLNIITVGIINLFIAWFPKLNLYLYYKVTYLETATHFGVFSKENELLVVKKKVIDLPEIDTKGQYNILNRFHLNINYEEKQIIMFEYKLFDYIFIKEKDNFETIDYRIKQKQSVIIEEYSSGLNPNEVELMKLIFGIC